MLPAWVMLEPQSFCRNLRWERYPETVVQRLGYSVALPQTVSRGGSRSGATAGSEAGATSGAKARSGS